MTHPEILLAPALMLADYYLTLLAASMLGPGHARRSAYELNPMFKHDVGALRLVNLRHLAATIMVGVALYVLARLAEPLMYRLALGLAVGVLTVLVGGHIANILDLRHLKAHPRDLASRARMNYRMQLVSSAHRMLGASALPLAAVAAFERGAFSCGAAAGAILLAVQPWAWLKQQDEATATALSPLPAVCAFCEREDRQVQRLIAGHGAMICDECVGTCVEALTDDKHEAPAPATAPQAAA